MAIIDTITGDPMLLTATVLGSLSVALIVYGYKNGKSLNPLGSKVRSKSPHKYAEKVRDAVKGKAEDQGDQIPDLAVAQLDNLLSHAVSHGREIERAKGQNSDKLYKMVGLTLLISGVNFLALMFLIFG